MTSQVFSSISSYRNYNDGVQAAQQQTQQSQEESKDKNELGQSAFLELMITQLNSQDPLNPAENTEFIAQLAQFSAVEGMERLNTNFEGFTNQFLSNQALQASSMVGRSVTVPSEEAILNQGQVVSGSVDLESATANLNLNIYSEGGELVERVPLGFQPEGESVFRWDGYNLEINGELHEWDHTSGEPLPPGTYRFEATASQGGEVVELDTALSANVNSVTMGNNGQLTLNLAGIGAVSVDQVKQFN